jgi:uncharacterized sulfatase
VPLRNGLTRNPHPDGDKAADELGLDPDEVTLAEVLKENGYATIAIGKWHLGHRPEFYPTRQGFDSYYGILYSNDMLPVQIMEDDEVAVKPVDQRTLTRDYTRRAVKFIEENKEQPFFLYLPHAMPHKPLAASEAFYTPDTREDLYADVIRELDWSVGEIVTSLAKHGLSDKTIVIFTSDNGPFYGGSTGGLRGKKATSWDGGTRVPFVIRYPEVFPSGATEDTPFWSLDLFPTLVSLCGVKPPAGVTIDGEVVTELLQGKEVSHGPIVTSHREEVTTIRQGDWKFYISPPDPLSRRDLDPGWVDAKAPDGVNIIAQTEQATNAEYPGLKPPKKITNPHPLFNVRTDPSESHDLSAERTDVVDRLSALHDAFRAGLEAGD